MDAEHILALVDAYGQAVGWGDGRHEELLAQIGAAVTRLAGDADRLATAETFSIWYRSVTPDGTLWCESSNRDEVADQSVGYDCTFQRLINRLVRGRWEPWDPKETT